MRFSVFISILILISTFQSCKPDDDLTGDCFIPNSAVNITVNMDLPQYYNLRNLGEFLSFENQGNRGVYLIHNYDDIYYAIERTCTYQSENECSQIQLDNDILQLKCGMESDTGFVECCSSTYAYNSGFLTGPTRCNLKTYRVSRNGNTLNVTN